MTRVPSPPPGASGARTHKVRLGVHGGAGGDGRLDEMGVLEARPGRQVPRVGAAEHGNHLPFLELAALLQGLDEVGQVGQGLVC